MSTLGFLPNLGIYVALTAPSGTYSSTQNQSHIFTFPHILS